MTNLKLGFAGIGRMGTPMVKRLIAAGYTVSVYDTNDAVVSALTREGAGRAKTPAELMGLSDVILLSLPTPEIVHAVALGSNGLVSGKGATIVIDLSTTGPRTERQMAEGLRAAGITTVDCPVSGGVGGAEKGTLAMMVACDVSTMETVRPILETLGKPIHVGAEPGMGQMMKVINNLMSVTALSIASEALVLATKAGLDPDILIDVVNSGSGSSNATMTKIPKFVLTRSFDFGFSIGLSAKDIRLCLEESDALGVPMIVGAAVRQLLTVAKSDLGADADLTEIIKPIEDWAGVTVAGMKAKG
ncbi:NAD(P)-dependent oxidoreductase [Mesorhizobium sp. M7A.F.Ca.CA.001.09.2.1]|uniref:NAD(P)-dependent oxidoreductase n=1 Tax=Mesorhizobium ciceri TaxID=39645 RepID=A0AB38TAV0_9HYPH|nr:MULTISPECIES: NAD(P)-dependent oxidoreductase [Mesorhizobium]RUY58618.1 NAD(P)-dependent oxidoreductase [Mesorhizobium sp. M7A.F.Ca.CA.001.13.2.1]MDF3216919.1 NAD(P)-dependent oxidoreductase [Mesorhizobium ciceri]RUY70147.1 NAD(P)-dependent oxidoreductase [Mesorhizobium sp. M7A.F.Ca.CA.001.13.1.1]RUY72720.1 NAD(P)-dependent oxidoreductase [Mesorhizobium sp. M7A.F.Ca.CA.001.05.1.1]RUY80939.1 NAD(P)-dependent oxidoreductase [Mesorhizobium sp. M7A.F.Ca.CA.001.09.2.1]